MAGKIIIVVFMLIITVLLAYIFSLRSALKETARELNEKMNTDTNTLISISSADRAICNLACEINKQLSRLREERLKLQYGNAELKSAVTGISHDLRTPLTAICGYLDLMEQEELSQKGAQYLAIIRERTEAMRNLTEELFKYSVISDSAEELRAEPVSLNDILERSLAGLYSVLADRGIVPSIEMPQQPVERMLDKSALRRIFDNVLSNAAKYSDGDLTVRLTKYGEIIFENSAAGLDVVRTEQLFDRFFTVNTASGGTGLGLSIAKLLTEKMGGSITAEFCKGKLSVRIKF